MREPGCWVECSDPFDRDRAVGVLPDGTDAGRVFLVAPPGGVAKLDAAQSRRLLAALDAATAGRAGFTQGTGPRTDGQ